MTFPGGYLTSNWRPSRCVTVNWKPHRASTRPIRWTMWRSLPSRRKSYLRYKTHICCLGSLHQIAWINVDFIHYPSYSIIKNSFVINRSCLFWGTSCSFSCSTRTISPGSMPGAWSASPVNVIFCPCLMPLSTWTSRTLVSLQTLWPSHFLQRSFSFITSPGRQPHTQNRRPQRAVLLRFVH